jgi:hypothetical protein
MKLHEPNPLVRRGIAGAELDGQSERLDPEGITPPVLILTPRFSASLVGLCGPILLGSLAAIASIPLKIPG